LPALSIVALLALATLCGIWTTPAFAQTYGTNLVTLENLSGTNASSPYGTVVLYYNTTTQSYSLWGTTSSGINPKSDLSTNEFGTVFDLNPLADVPSTTFTIDQTLTSSNKTSKGSHPYCGLTLASDGNLYGVTEYGGADGYGTVFQVNPKTATYTVIYSFQGTGTTDGANPYGGLIEVPGPNSTKLLCGTTVFTTPYAGYGTIYTVTESTTPTVALLHSFASTDGAYPQSALTYASDGYLYGVTQLGGADGDGVVYRLLPTSTSNNYSVIHSFTGTSDGSEPDCQMLEASNDVLYGTTDPNTDSGVNCGTIFTVTTGGSPTLTTVAAFGGSSDELSTQGTNTNGAFPSGSLVQMPTTGWIYGTVLNGGASGNGGVYCFNPSAATITPTMVYNFSGIDDGGGPLAGLSLGTIDGVTNVFGTTSGGFQNIKDTTENQGSVFEIYGLPIIGNLTTVPSPATTGSQFTLNVIGTDFDPNSAVATYNGTPLVTKSVTSTQITATVPASLNTTAGSIPIVVYNDYGQADSLASTAVNLTVDSATPVITSIVPTSTVAGAPASDIFINGTGFVSGETVGFASSISGAPTSLTVVSTTSTQIEATLPEIDNSGTATITVNNNNGTAVSNGETFTVNASGASQPVITSISPTTSAADGATAVTLTITGSNFATSGEVVKLFNPATQVTSTLTPNTSPAPTSTSMTVTIPSSLIPSPNAVTALVWELNQASEISNALPFTFTAVEPTLTSLTPSSVTVDDAQFPLTIAGSNFNTSGVTVNFGSVAIKSTTSLTSSSVTVNVPASAVKTAGYVSVTVDNDNGSTLSTETPLTFTVSAQTGATPSKTFSGSGYQMISIPGDSGVPPFSLLGVVAATWDAESDPQGYVISPKPPADQFRLGQAYWINLKSGETPSVYIAATTATSASVSLYAGWNMIGDPFSTAAPISEITFTPNGSSTALSFAKAVSDGIITGALFTYQSGDTAYQILGSAGSLTPYWGYWIWVSEDCTMSLAPSSSS
jgi:uncharacterized repeat protein (TIGR03803 family)